MHIVIGPLALDLSSHPVKKKEETEFLGFYRLQFLSNFFVLFKKALF